MSTVKDNTIEMYKNVSISRNAFPMARYFFDVHIGEDGIHAYYMWKRNDYRFPIYHHIVDFLKRNRRMGKNRKETVDFDPKNVFINYDDIQGVVTYQRHKEIQLLSTSEQIYFLFRSTDDYESFVSHLREKIEDTEDNEKNRYYTRDNVEITDTVYIS